MQKTEPLYRHVVDDCFGSGSIGSRLTHNDYEREIARCQSFVHELAKPKSPELKAVLSLPSEVCDLVQAQLVCNDWRKRFDKFVLFGVGGSSLGARALSVLAKTGELKMIVPDNLDVLTMAQIIPYAHDPRTAFLVVSKSGRTPETLAQVLTTIDEICISGGKPSDRFVIVVEPGASPLRHLAEKFEIRLFNHDPLIGGRFSVLSLVGMLPAMLLGLDPKKFRRGASYVLEKAMMLNDPELIPSMVGAAISVALMKRGDVSQTVLMAYGDILQPFSLWQRQLWAESIGKNGLGSNPVPSLGPVDQHSQLQLYLDGPPDKFYTILTMKMAGRGAVIPEGLANSVGLDYLSGKTIGDLVSAMQEATAAALAARNHPVRQIELEDVDEFTMGGLFMHFILETLCSCRLLDIDPFSQPAVEEGKILTREFLIGRKR